MARAMIENATSSDETAAKFEPARAAGRKAEAATSGDRARSSFGLESIPKVGREGLGLPDCWRIDERAHDLPAPAGLSCPDFRIGGEDEETSDGFDGWARPIRTRGNSITAEMPIDPHRSGQGASQRLAEATARMPAPGDLFLGFRLIGELGRGAFGRVFLASQGDLADRPVALKVSTDKPAESQTLAQLQHTNIVPIFSAHRAGPFYAVCMPYFGSTTLKDIFEGLEDQPSLPTTGEGLLKTLDQHRSGVGSSVGSRQSRSAAAVADESGAASPWIEQVEASSPARLSSDNLKMLKSLTYVEAVLWMGSRLADGLAHAHGRGILHRDIKPANVLLTDDGQPMLLDFNLSEDLKATVSGTACGGTLPYMSPEHLRAFSGEEVAVDARSDVYALGVILHELLGGRHPFESYQGRSAQVIARMIADRSAPLSGLRVHNPQVSPAVESIVRHCLEPDPDRRYQSAAALHEDLERHLANLPLRHAPEPSTRERVAKWSRRHPRLTSSTSMAILAGFAMFGAFAAFLARGERLARLEAVDALARFRVEASGVRYLLNTRVHDRDRRARAVGLGRDALEPYRAMVDPNWLEGPLVRPLDAAERRDLRDAAGSTLLFLARAGLLDAEGRKADVPALAAEVKAALRLCDLAGSGFEPGRVPRDLLEIRADLQALAGRDVESRKLRAEAEATPLRTALDHELAATSRAHRGQYVSALPLALEATRLDPRDFWAWLTLGFCQEKLGQHNEAVASYGTCIALRPDSPVAWFDRGITQTQREDYEQARRDLDRASALDPNWPDPFAERAIAELQAGQAADAVRDFTRAIELGATEGRLLFLRASAKAKAGDAEGARLDRLEGFRREPRDDLGWVVRAMARPADDAAGSLADFDRALAINPRSLDALQGKAYILAERMGRIEEAERVLDRAVGFYPDFVPSRSSRGVLRAILGRREAAHLDARESLWRDTSAVTLFQVAGIYAITSKVAPEDRVEAYRLLSTALRKGFGFDELAEDRELDSIRDQPEFRKLLEAAKALGEAPAAGAGVQP